MADIVTEDEGKGQRARAEENSEATHGDAVAPWMTLAQKRRSDRGEQGNEYRDYHVVHHHGGLVRRVANEVRLGGLDRAHVENSGVEDTCDGEGADALAQLDDLHIQL
jgi:hypothetical protein